MTINLKIELLRVFTIEFSLSSDKESKKDTGNEEDSSTELGDDQPASTSR